MGGLCCFARKKSSKEDLPEAKYPQISEPIPAEPIVPIPEMRPPEKPSLNFRPPPSPPRILHKFDSPHVHISTYFSDADIIELQLTPRETIRKTVHFVCPICMSYFNVILVSKCCQNYICHRCAKDMLRTEASFEVRCPHCNADPLELVDVDPKKTLKVYSDSFAKQRMGRNSGDNQPLNTIPEVDTARRDSLDDVAIKDSPLGMDDSFEDNRV